ncbi:hypothetical protein GCM10027187_40130 [Streptosporangium sandarakinum]|uniref:Uncharacterized protein n=1 Tax=Streptosporangium sandarakinum TaxID=1260955 RepID=A0A852VEM1_9ACTN|nr:hypothetical protein [Streptosporangium sandarakinum]NYF44655.1 hypothetical protein [Streptosporangium sandarakinum]
MTDLLRLLRLPTIRRRGAVFVRSSNVRAALTAAGRLQTAFARHGLDVDAHQLARGRAAVSVARGVLVYTDGFRFWWVTWDTPRRGKPWVTHHTTTEGVVEELLQHPAVVKRRQITDTPHLPI